MKIIIKFCNKVKMFWQTGLLGVITPYDENKPVKQGTLVVSGKIPKDWIDKEVEVKVEIKLKEALKKEL